MALRFDVELCWLDVWTMRVKRVVTLAAVWINCWITGSLDDDGGNDGVPEFIYPTITHPQS